ncbi:C-type lectin domain family 4 member E-like [Lithobates pipiens]
MRKSEDLEIEQENSGKEGIYISLSDLDLQGKKKGAKAKGNTDKKGIYINLCDLDLGRRKKDAKAKVAQKAQYQLIRILVAILFLILVVFIGVVFTFYKNITDELSSLRETGSSHPLCAMNWRYYNLSCYYKSCKEIQWNSAKEECEKKSAHLVVINGEDEMEFLCRFAEEQSLWVGLKKERPEGWKWVDGTSHNTTKFWLEGEPNNYNGKEEDCVHLRYGKGLNDIPCDTTYPYICEKKLP